MWERRNFLCVFIFFIPLVSELDEERGKGEYKCTHFPLLHAFFSVKKATTILTKINAETHGENITHWQRDAQENQASL